MTSVWTNVFIDKLDDIINKYNNTYHRTIKIKSADVKSSTYLNSSKEVNNEDLKFKIGDIIRISKYKNIFCKRLCSKFLWLKKVKNTVPLAYVISDLKGEEVFGTF